MLTVSVSSAVFVSFAVPRLASIFKVVRVNAGLIKTLMVRLAARLKLFVLEKLV